MSAYFTIKKSNYGLLVSPFKKLIICIDLHFMRGKKWFNTPGNDLTYHQKIKIFNYVTSNHESMWQIFSDLSWDNNRLVPEYFQEKSAMIVSRHTYFSNLECCYNAHVTHIFQTQSVATIITIHDYSCDT